MQDLHLGLPPRGISPPNGNKSLCSPFLWGRCWGKHPAGGWVFSTLCEKPSTTRWFFVTSRKRKNGTDEALTSQCLSQFLGESFRRENEAVLFFPIFVSSDIGIPPVYSPSSKIPRRFLKSLFSRKTNLAAKFSRGGKTI